MWLEKASQHRSTGRVTSKRLHHCRADSFAIDHLRGRGGKLACAPLLALRPEVLEGPLARRWKQSGAVFQNAVWGSRPSSGVGLCSGGKAQAEDCSRQAVAVGVAEQWCSWQERIAVPVAYFAVRKHMRATLMELPQSGVEATASASCWSCCCCFSFCFSRAAKISSF